MPSGIATDDTTKYFFRALTESRGLASLYSFFEIRALFPGTDSRSAFCLLTLAGTAVSDSVVDFAFDLRSAADLDDPERRFTLSAEDITLLNPNTRTCPIFRTRRDAEITKGIYRRVPVLIREAEPGGRPEENPWGVSFMAMLHMSNDSDKFRTREELERDGWTLRGNVFHRGADRHLPLYEAKMIHHFNHRFGDYADRPAESESTALPEVPVERLQDPNYQPLPRYWVAEPEVDARLAGRWNRGWLLGWRDICRATDERTVIAGVVPRVGVGHTAPLALFHGTPAPLLACLLACWSSFVFDYGARQKVGGTHLTYGYLMQLPQPAPRTYCEAAPWDRQFTIAAWLLPRILELACTSWDLQPFVHDLDFDAPPFRWDYDRRALLRAELDGAFFHLYGVSRDDASHILDSFPIVKRMDEARYGEYRVKRVTLDVLDAMQTASMDRTPYRSPFSPPPGVRVQ